VRITALRWRASGAVCRAVLLILLSAAQSAGAQAEEIRQDAVLFDIPEQPLALALDHYSAVTGVVGLYRGQLAVGRMSRTVVGRYTPSAALVLLLQGTGLAAEYAAADAFVIVPRGAPALPAKPPGAVARAALASQDIAERDYSALIQERINQALCAGQLTQPGAYRAALNFRIGMSGDVEQFQLLGPSGDPQRDDAIAHALTGLAIGRPPAHMPQPFTMVLLPASSGGVVDCHAMKDVRRDG
jgi:hypothetical protein